MDTHGGPPNAAPAPQELKARGPIVETTGIHVFRLVVLSGVMSLCVAAAVLPVIPGDSGRGAQLFTTERCIECHSIDGKGGNKAPDLGQRIDRNFTPALLASTM